MSQPTTPSTIRVAVAVYVFNKHGQTILGLRQGSLGAGTWGHPGGHLELNETFEACAAREVLEETGLQVTDIRFLTAINNIMLEEGKHYVTVFVGCRLVDEDAVPKVMEPEKCVKWEWVSWNEMKLTVERQAEAERLGRMERYEGRVLFKPILKLFEQRRGFNPLEAYGPY
ncbi:7,8-dihydro-8-oxoguanine triphosphatase NUDT15 [Aspergillus sclerotioniger CBS 115572]|uniref:7,8-dihydro-8-oxoguanine triphosphatase NUDT15 n=1 Tax=Aspergillus sclerotioniger CBS 115572 TaxID=1450535 RepID=A0A317X100_9EURO|nr:7,8-dihydro-8-oxoguanine triphosphatase NUDT15 [Aspergillus sclerotioniger CBS 115572]PWY90628.1 7,8-dihydro-8-oxoguanine triphosphatase NUDT15 [Aspergillus sclerotioniger CBS 115572]